jgi:hypothetical protein
VIDPAGEVKTSVVEIHRFSKAARDAVRLVESQRAGSGRAGNCYTTSDDQEYNEALKQILGKEFNGEIWLPPK